jgi:hypothetical protein
MSLTHTCFSLFIIRIGWGYGETRIINVNSYEDARRGQRTQIDMVLTREARQDLLLKWGVSFNDIVDSIRGNIKAKNQRRQTVSNLGKVQHLEEAFESVARKLKRTLLHRKRTGNLVKEMQTQADMVQRLTLSTLKIAEDRALSEIWADNTAIEEQEPDGEDHLEHSELIVQVSNFCRTTPEETGIRRTSFGSLREDMIDGLSSMEGLTIGNSTTASALEMERFYRELELEMFGDELPLSMVGQTLELPSWGVDTSDDLTTVSGLIDSPEPHRSFEFASQQSYPLYNNLPVHANNNTMMHHSNEMSLPVNALVPPIRRPVDLENNFQIHQQHERDYPVVHRQFTDLPDAAAPPAMGIYSYHHPPHYPISIPTRHNSYPLPESSPMNNHSEQHMNQSEISRLSSLDYAPDMPMMMHPLPQIGQPPVVVHSQDATTPRRLVTSLYPGVSKTTASTRVRDEPQIRHIPPPMYLSSTHFMEGNNSPMTIRASHEPVTITEDTCGRSGVHLQLGEGGSDYPSPHQVTRQFPSSFY